MNSELFLKGVLQRWVSIRYTVAIVVPLTRITVIHIIRPVASSWQCGGTAGKSFGGISGELP